MKWSLLSKCVARASRVMCERLKWKTLLGNWSVKVMLNMAQRRPCWHSWFKQATEAVIGCHNARPCCVQTALECRQRWFGGTRCLLVRAASDMVSRAFYMSRFAAPPTLCTDREGLSIVRLQPNKSGYNYRSFSLNYLHKFYVLCI